MPPPQWSTKANCDRLVEERGAHRHHQRRLQLHHLQHWTPSHLASQVANEDDHHHDHHDDHHHDHHDHHHDHRHINDNQGRTSNAAPQWQTASQAFLLRAAPQRCRPTPPSPTTSLTRSSQTGIEQRCKKWEILEIYLCYFFSWC